MWRVKTTPLVHNALSATVSKVAAGFSARRFGSPERVHGHRDVPRDRPSTNNTIVDPAYGFGKDTSTSTTPVPREPRRCTVVVDGIYRRVIILATFDKYVCGTRAYGNNDDI